MALLLGACGGGATEEDTATTATASTPTTTAAAGGQPAPAFPVTVEHRYGSTTVAAEPRRIVTVGLTDHDVLLALGIVPVGTTEWFGDHPGAVWPWARDELGDAPVPALVGDAGTINFEAIAALRPDLVLAVYAGLTESDHETLAAIAPTIAQPAGTVDYGVAWDEQARIIGRAVGRADDADALVAEVEAAFDAARAEHPEFVGATGLVATPQDGSVAVYSSDDARGRFMADLGFEHVAEIDDDAGDGFSADVSMERVDLIDVDALVWIVNDIDTDEPRFRADPLYAALDVSTERRDVFVENLSELGGATSFVSVLSLPFLLDGLVPKLAAAVDGDPATEVPYP